MRSSFAEQMHFVLVTIGSHGDVHPFIGIGQMLQTRGHRVTLITNGAFESLVRRAGIADFVAIGSPEEFDRMVSNPDLWHKRKGTETILGHIGEYLPLMLETLQAHVTPESTVIASSLSLSALVDSELRNIRTATVHLAPAVFMSSVEPPKLPGIFIPRFVPIPIRRIMFGFGSRFFADPMIAPALNELRTAHGLPAVRNVLFEYWHSPHLVIGLFPEWFAKPASDWPASTVVTHFPLYDEAEIESLSESLETFLADGSPPIAFTPGSAMRFGHDFFATAVEACGRINRRALLLSRHEEQIPKNLPPHALHVPYAPFSRLLPRCAAIVHHGGIGTTSQALRAGVPQLIMPLSHDQPDNAHRLEKLGVGGTVWPGAFRPKRVATSLSKLLDDPAVEERCRAIAASFPKNSLEPTCDVLEKFAASKEPLPTRGR